jgi:cytochrome c-type biogenesis protein CcmH/NrfG
MKKVVVLSVIVLAALAALWIWGRPAYRRHKETRFLEQTRRFVAKGDYRNASLSARQVLQVDPGNVEACEITANLADMTRSPHALDWRRKVAELAPTIQNKLLLARTAMGAQSTPYPLAAQTLEEIRDAAKELPAYHVLLAELALKLKKVSEAEAEFGEASRLEPTNEMNRLNVAVLRLQSTNDSLAAEARGTLDRLTTNPQLAAIALRWLTVESIRRNDLSKAETYSSELLTNVNSVPDDRLQRLSVLDQAGDLQLKTYLPLVQRMALTNAVETQAVALWMVRHGLADEALRWLTNCPPKLRNEQPVPLAFVDAFIAKKDWGSLESYLQEQKWGDSDFLRSAFLSRATSEQKQVLATESHWRTALRLSGERLGPLLTLLNLASSWGRDDAREDLLWRIAQKFPRERWSLTELEGFYSRNHDTRGLYKVYVARVGYDPTNLVARNNLAATSLLLNLNLAQAHQLAQQDHLQQPDDPIITSTYAFSLHSQGRTRDGLTAFEKLSASDLQKAPVALYYGVLLAAVGENSKAGKYLQIARTGDLLPEEKGLLANAQR